MGRFEQFQNGRMKFSCFEVPKDEVKCSQSWAAVHTPSCPGLGLFFCPKLKVSSGCSAVSEP